MSATKGLEEGPAIVTTKRSCRSAWLTLAAVTLFGTAIRLYKLDAQCLWMDEIASLNNVHTFASDGLRALARADRIAPLHTIILWIATTIGGESALVMRIPSAIAGIITIPVLYFMALRLFGSQKIAIVSAALVAFSPYVIAYAQEARMYAILLLCACLFVMVSWPVVERSLRASELVLVTLVTILGYYTHHYMVLLSAAFGLFLIICGGLAQSRAWIWLSTQVVAFLSFAYWLVLSADQLGSQTALPRPTTLLWLPYTLYTFVVGLSFGPSVRELQTGNISAVLLHHAFPVGVAAFVSFILVATGIWIAMRREFRVAGVWLIIWLVVPIVLAIFATFVTKIQYNVRYAIVSYPPIALFLALAISQIGRSDIKCVTTCWGTNGCKTNDRWWHLRNLIGAAALRILAVIVLGLVVTISLANWYFDPAYGREEVRPLAALLAHDRSSKLVVLDNARIRPILAYYGAVLPDQTLQIDNLLWGRTPEIVLQELDQIETRMPREIWLIGYRTSENDPSGLVSSRLNATADLIEERNWPGVSLRRYHLRQSVR